MNPLERRCIDISYAHKLSHLSSVLGTVNVLNSIYSDKEPQDVVVLGNAHAALALYVVLEKWERREAVSLLIKHGIHSCRDLDDGIHVSGGSLGQAETIAVGMALGKRNRKVHLVTSDGALAEGCIWESLAIMRDQHLDNLKLHVIANGLTAYRSVDALALMDKVMAFIYPLEVEQTSGIACVRKWPAWLRTLKGHYQVLNESQYEELLLC